MKPLTCAAARRRLQAFHDGELTVPEQIAVSAHLEWCEICAAALADVRAVGSVLRAAAPGAAALTHEEAASFHRSVVSRANAEFEASYFARVRDMFEDMHLVYAALGAAGATAVCILIMLGMMRFATSGRPDSLAAIVNVLASPGSNENPVAVDARVLMPRDLDGALSTISTMSVPASTMSQEQDAVFTLAAVVTREGRIVNLELLHANPAVSGNDDGKVVEGLLDAVSRAHFEPGRAVEGNPVAVNMVWLVAHTTVRASKAQTKLDLPVLPTVKKRAAAIAGDAHIVA